MARRIEVEIIGDSRKLERAFDRSGRSAKKFEASITGMGRSLNRSFAALGVGIGVGTAVAGMKTLVNAASDLNEEMSKNRVVFGKNAAALEKWSKTTANTLGISERQALATASGFGALFQPLGIAGDEAAKQSRRLTELGADLASFYNTDVQSALDAIRSGLIGEAEPMRRYGALLSETRVAAEAMAESGKKSATQLTAQEKVQARINLIFRDTTKAQGDASRTGDQFAGQMRRLTAQLEDLEAGLGGALLPHMTALVDQFNAWLANPENKQAVIDGFTTAVNDLGAAFEYAAGAAGTMKGIFDWFSGHKGPSGKDILGKVGITGATTDFAGRLGIGGKSKPGPGSTDVPFPPGWFNVPQIFGGTTGGGTAGSRGGIPGQVGPVVTNALDTILGTAKKWLAAGKKFDEASKAWEATQKANAARRARMEQQRDRLRAGRARQLDWLEFGVEQAEATGKKSKIVAALRKEEAWWKARIVHEGRKYELVTELWRTQQKIRDLNKKNANKDPLAGLMQASTKQLTNILAAGTGLTAAGRGRLAYNIAGAEPLVVHNHVYIGGREVANAINAEQTKVSRRTAAQTSGRRG